MAIKVERVVTYTGEIDFKKKYLVEKMDDEFKETIYRDMLAEFLREMQNDGIVFDPNTGDVTEVPEDEFIQDPDDETSPEENEDQIVSLQKIDGIPTTDQLVALYKRGLEVREIEPLIEPEYWNSVRARLYDYLNQHEYLKRRPKRKKKTAITEELKETFVSLYNLGKRKKEIMTALDISTASYSRVLNELIERRMISND
jgi:hypothetical protein